MDLSTIDFALLFKLLGGAAVALLAKGGWSYMTRRLELKVKERDDERNATAAARAFAEGSPERFYGPILDRLNKEIERLRLDDEAVATTVANSLSLFKDVFIKMQSEVSLCHEERRRDREEYNARLQNERDRRHELQLRVEVLETQVDAGS